MAKTYEAICESLRLAGEQKLVKLSNTFQEHQHWLKQAFEDARAQLKSQKEVPGGAKPGRGRGASDKENAPAPKRSGRRRGAPAKALDPIAEEAQPEEDARPEPEATMEAEAEPAPLTVPELNVQESAPLGNVATGKPPLPGRPRGGRAAKDEQGTERNHVAVGQDSAEENPAADKAAVAPPPETANTGRRTTRRTANSGSEAARPPQPPRQTRRAAAVKAAAAIAANAAAEGPAPEARAAAATENAAPTDADGSPDDQAGKHPAAGQRDKEGPAEEDDAADEEHEPQASRGRRAKGPAPSRDSGNQAAAGDVIAEAGGNKMPSPGPQRAGTRAAKSATAATPAQRKRTATSAPCTTRRMAAVERAAVAKPDVQAHRLELSDEDSDVDMKEDGSDMEQDDAIGNTTSPVPDTEDATELQKDEEREATPPAVEDTPVLKGAAATAARPKRAAAEAAQRAIAATAVKRHRGRRMSGASLASVPGTTRRTRQTAAVEEEARTTPAVAASELDGTGNDEAPATAEAAALHAEPQKLDLAEGGDTGDAKEAPNTGLHLQEPQESLGPAKQQQTTGEQHSLPKSAPAEPGAAAPSAQDPQGSAKALKAADIEHIAAGKEEEAAEPEQAQAAAEVDEQLDEDIVMDFEDAQDVFETPSQHPRFMTPGAFGTARQQLTAYKTGQEQLTGMQPSTGRPVFIRPELKSGPLARAAAAAAAAAAQPPDSNRAARAPELGTVAQQGCAVQRLKQQYERAAPTEPAAPAEKGSQGEPNISSAAEQEQTSNASLERAAEDSKEGPADAAEAAPAQTGVAGMGANLVSTVRSFLPFVSKSGDAQPQPAAGKKPVKVRALEAAEAARRKEAQRATERAAQRQQVEAQKAERAKRAQDAKAAQAEREEEARRLAQEALNRKEEEAAARRHAKEEAERMEREERQKRQEELRQKRKQAEQERAAAEEKSRKAAHDEEERKRNAAKHQDVEAKRPRLQGPTALAKPAPRVATAPSQAGPAAKPAGADLPAPQQQTSAARPQAAESAADLAYRPATAMPIQGVVKPSTPIAEIAKAGVQASSAAAARPDSEQFQSYELSPYRSGSDCDDSEEDAEREKKPVPKWARGQALTQALVAQMTVDPDEIFKLHQKTCPLNEVFSDKGASERHPRKDLNRRTSSGNWIEDRVTWKEELNYKKAMGYL